MSRGLLLYTARSFFSVVCTIFPNWLPSWSHRPAKRLFLSFPIFPLSVLARDGRYIFILLARRSDAFSLWSYTYCDD
ncbi:hypothetical protein BJX96DRAFT_122243 [Aspergillus floccosus]